MKKNLIFFSLLIMITIITQFMVPVKCETYETWNRSESYGYMYQPTTLNYNSSILYIRLLNAPNQSIDGFNIHDLELISSRITFFMVGSNPDLQTVHVRFIGLKNFYPTWDYEADWRDTNPPFTQPSVSHNFTASEIERDILSFIMVFNITLTDTTTAYFNISYSISAQYGYYVFEGIGIDLVDGMLNILPLFVVLFAVPFVSGKYFGKHGFLLSLIAMTLIVAFTSLLSLSYSLILLISEIGILVMLYRREKNNE